MIDAVLFRAYIDFSIYASTNKYAIFFKQLELGDAFIMSF